MIVSIENNDPNTTLTTYLYCSFWQAYAAEQQGHLPYISWPRYKSVASYDDAQMFQQVPNQFEWYFEQPFTNDKNFSEVRTWNTDHNTGLFPLMSQPLHVIREFYKRNLIFNQAVNSRGQQLADKYDIDFRKTIGITWRGTDIYIENQNGVNLRKRMPIETYFPFIDELLERQPDLRIACTAEEEKILDPLLSRYPNAFKIEEFLQSPFNGKHNPERFTKVSGFERGLQPALMVWFFSKCAHYIKNRASTAAVASWLSDGRIVNLMHSETLSYEEMNGYAEIKGQRYLIEGYTGCLH